MESLLAVGAAGYLLGSFYPLSSLIKGLGTAFKITKNLVVTVATKVAMTIFKWIKTLVVGTAIVIRDEIVVVGHDCYSLYKYGRDGW